jgi:hypothetical protein
MRKKCRFSMFFETYGIFQKYAIIYFLFFENSLSNEITVHCTVMLAQFFLLVKYLKKYLYIQLTVEAKVICQSFRWRHEPRGRSERYHSRQTSEIREISFPPDIYVYAERYHSRQTYEIREIPFPPDI